MKISDLEDKKIVLLGFGREGSETLRVLRKYFTEKHFTIADQNENLSCLDKNVSLLKGVEYQKNLGDFDVIIKTPGIPMSPELKLLEEKITSATQIFFDSIDSSNTVVGVTGSKGKSTVVSMLFEVLKEAGRQTELIGNIGVPALKYVECKNTTFVCELSSYQLEGTHIHPHIAIITSLFPDHLTYHGGFDNYFNAKKNITRGQSEEDFLIVNKRYEKLTELETKAKKIIYGREDSFWYDGEFFYEGKDKIFSVNILKILGDHNKDNVLAVLAAAKLLKIENDVVEKSISQFRGLPHRLEYVDEIKDVHFYDDAISTTPESTIAGIEVFKEKLGSIILGGEDRGYEFDNLVQKLKEYKVSTIVLLPDTGEKIGKIIRVEKEYSPVILSTREMEEAVQYCLDNTPQGKVCLLSTASPSYSLYKNFEEKGDLFKKCVKSLI
ncbi:MAG: UDP-N-acetylmuramoyl-L-alanine--D-glutamate ligase [Candidatus Pacebacteria bacterium]|nr:UDP-N-acetylmuramoyl-L-alanine--D-glutamate ligase [Candidatus Paceibacterota bacterium]